MCLSIDSTAKKKLFVEQITVIGLKGVQIERPRSGSAICFITSMIALHELDGTKSCYQLIITNTISRTVSEMFQRM